MPTVTVITFDASDADFIQTLNSFVGDVANAVNTHHQELLSAIGPGALLIEDVFDRDGIVGEHSYQLDIPNYTGGTTITIGRRPVPIAARGEVDVSIGWITIATGKTRITLTGDLVLSGAAVITGLPKTIYVRVGASGVPQVLETEADTNLMTLYKATWDGFSWTNITRTAHILGGGTTLMALAGEPRRLLIHDGQTNWVDPGVLDSDTELVTLGRAVDNGIGIDGEVEILGFEIHPHRATAGGWFAPSVNPPESLVTLRVVSEAEEWTAANFEIDCGQAPDSLFAAVAGAIGSKKFVNELRRFRLELVSVGSGVVSARGFSWGVIYAPVLGASVPKDSTALDQI